MSNFYEFCFVVERVKWEENMETGAYWEDRHICRAFKTYGAAVSYIESNSAGTGLSMEWQGDKIYSGSDFVYASAFRTDTLREGLRYEIHYVPLD